MLIVLTLIQVTMLCKLLPGQFLHLQGRRPREELMLARDIELGRMDKGRSKRKPIFPWPTNLYYALRLVGSAMLDSGDGIPQVLTDTSFSIWTLTLEKHSNARFEVEKFCDLPALRAEDINNFILDTFKLSNTDIAPLSDRLAKFAGRPLLFVENFLGELIEKMAVHKPATTSALAVLLEEACDGGFKNARAHMQGLINRAANSTTPVIAGTPTSPASIVQHMYAVTRLKGGRYKSSNKVVTELVTAGLAHLSKDPEQASVDLKQEPAVWEALQLEFSPDTPPPADDDCGFKYVANSLIDPTTHQATKGIRGEHACAFALFRQHGHNLLDMPGFADVLPAGHWLEDYKVFARIADSAKHSFLSASSSGCIFFPPDGAGPDLVVRLRKSADDIATEALSVWQCKVKKKPKFAGAIRSLDPNLFFKPRRQKKIDPDSQADDSKDSLPDIVPDASVVSFFATSGLLSRFVRVIFNRSGFSRSLIESIRAYNSDKQNEESPVLLLQSSPELFGGSLHMVLMSDAKGQDWLSLLHLYVVARLANGSPEDS